VLAAEHLLGFARIDLRLEVVERAREIVADRLPRLRPFDEDAEIVNASLEAAAQIAVFLETAPPLQELLRPLLVFPEIRVCDALFDAGELVALA
jgi:hypothetical protein